MIRRYSQDNVVPFPLGDVTDYGGTYENSEDSSIDTVSPPAQMMELIEKSKKYLAKGGGSAARALAHISNIANIAWVNESGIPDELDRTSTLAFAPKGGLNGDGDDRIYIVLRGNEWSASDEDSVIALAKQLAGLFVHENVHLEGGDEAMAQTGQQNVMEEIARKTKDDIDIQEDMQLAAADDHFIEASFIIKSLIRLAGELDSDGASQVSNDIDLILLQLTKASSTSGGDKPIRKIASSSDEGVDDLGSAEHDAPLVDDVSKIFDLQFSNVRGVGAFKRQG